MVNNSVRQSNIGL